jgi:hypothetical protein
VIREQDRRKGAAIPSTGIDYFSSIIEEKRNVVVVMTSRSTCGSQMAFSPMGPEFHGHH